MREIPGSIAIFLVFGGILTAVAGLVWNRTAPLLRLLHLPVNLDLGLRVALIGLGMIAVGLALVRLMR